MRTRLAELREEQGFALALVVMLGVVLATFSLTLIDAVSSESHRSADAITRDASYQAAEAGTDDYIAKLLSDHIYYSHEVHPGEATRRALDGTLVGHGAVWSGGLTWTYPNGKDAWRQLSNGYEYDIEVTAPTSSTQAVQIVSTGRPVGSTNTADWREIQTLFRQSSVSDFQMLADADISYGATASTYGKIYAGIDSHGVAHSVTHTGAAYADIYAEGHVYGPPALHNGAKTYDTSTIRSIIKTPVNFNDFLASLVDIQRASQVGGIYLSNAAVDAWKLTFQSNGTVQVQSCTKSAGKDIALAAPICGPITTDPVPGNGAIYAAQSAIVSGVVNGRVTVASNNVVVISNNITYLQSGDDVLGLVSANDMIVAQWAPTNLNWRSATIAQSGAWHSYSSDGSHGTLTFTGSTSTYLGGQMSMFQTRVYQYDDTLLYLQPPWFPTIDGAYTILLSRELPPTAS